MSNKKLIKYCKSVLQECSSYKQPIYETKGEYEWESEPIETTFKYFSAILESLESGHLVSEIPQEDLLKYLKEKHEWCMAIDDCINDDEISDYEYHPIYKKLIQAISKLKTEKPLLNLLADVHFML